jgi:hypothetical protein
VDKPFAALIRHCNSCSYHSTANAAPWGRTMIATALALGTCSIMGHSRGPHTVARCIVVTWLAGAGIFVSVSNLTDTYSMHWRTVPPATAERVNGGWHMAKVAAAANRLPWQRGGTNRLHAYMPAVTSTSRPSPGLGHAPHTTLYCMPPLSSHVCHMSHVTADGCCCQDTGWVSAAAIVQMCPLLIPTEIRTVVDDLCESTERMPVIP